MVRSFSNRVFGGVCGGFGQATPLNAWWWRMIFVGVTLVTGGLGPLLYVMWWWLLPQGSLLRRQTSGIPQVILGALLSLGLLAGWLFRGRMGPDVFWSTALLVAGFVIFTRQWMNRPRGNMALGLLAFFVPLVMLLSALQIIGGGYLDILQRASAALLIYVGLAIALRYRVRHSGLLAAGVSLALVAGVSYGAIISRQDVMRTDQELRIEQTIDPATTVLQLELTTVDTDVRLVRTSDSRVVRALYIGSENGSLRQSYEVDGSVAFLRLNEVYEDPFPKLEEIGRATVEVAIPQDVAIAIAFEGQRGTLNFDLATIQLERLKLDLQLGTALITMPSYQPRSLAASQNPGRWFVGEGDLRVTIPDSVGVQFFLDRATNSEPRRGLTYDDLLYRVELEDTRFVIISRRFDSLSARIRYFIDVPNGNFLIERPLLDDS